jgi:hypothetical protein
MIAIAKPIVKIVMKETITTCPYRAQVQVRLHQDVRNQHIVSLTFPISKHTQETSLP